MKKWKVLIVIVTAILLMGCSSSVPVDRGIEATIESVPYENLQYNEEKISLENIEIYQEVSSSGYGYYPYVVVTFDKTGLSEENFYWMIEDKDIDVTCYYTSEQNEVNFESMPLLKSYYDENELVYIFDEYQTEFKHDFTDIKVRVSIDLTQEETYKYKTDEGKISNLNKINEYTCYVNTSHSGIKDITELSEEEEGMRQIGLQEKYEYIENMYNSLNSN